MRDLFNYTERSGREIEGGKRRLDKEMRVWEENIKEKKEFRDRKRTIFEVQRILTGEKEEKKVKYKRICRHILFNLLY